MSNIIYQLTLTSENANSGPYYNVTYTTSSTYNAVITGSPAYLPNVGDTASVEIPSGSFSYLAFNLNNGITGCDYCDNDVLFVVTGSAPIPAPPNTASVSWSLSEYSASGVYINTDLSIFVNGTGSVLATTSSTGNFTMTASQAVTFSGLNSQPVSFPWPTGSAMYVTASKDNVIFFTGGTSLSGSIVSSSFMAVSGSVYSISVSSSYTAGGGSAPVEYIIDNAGNGTSAGACAGSTTTSYVYATAGNTVPIVGLILYDSSSLVNPFIGSAGWRKLVGPFDVYAAEVDITGSITNYVTCP